MLRHMLLVVSALLVSALFVSVGAANADDLPQQVRSVLSNRCFACHGPDEAERQGGLRLDSEASMLGETDSGEHAVVPGDPARSEILRRLISSDESERMPPPEFAARLTEDEINLVREWIAAGAQLPEHWAFVAPNRPALPTASWTLGENRPTHPVDVFVERKLNELEMVPSPIASRPELLRRLSLDLIGLPPTPQEVGRFVHDARPDAYQVQVDRLLASPAFGEHWARKWLDLARYADSAGYADDPSRTIWAYRDWVINAINNNLPVDQFTIEQIAGDLLPQPTDEQLVATAFHRNTLTNNEGGTNNEEFRNVAVVDRVNTTMAVWMGVTMACAQCHTHKYDPFTHEEYFQLFAVFNQSEDADLRDERPSLPVFTMAQRNELERLREELRLAKQDVVADQPTLEAEFDRWDSALQPPVWEAWPITIPSSGDGNAALQNPVVATATSIEFSLPQSSTPIHGFALKALPDAALSETASPGKKNASQGELLGAKVTGRFIPDSRQPALVRFVRVELPGDDKILSLAEVEVFSLGKNVALGASASQSSTDFGGLAQRAIDGKTDGEYESGSTTHTAKSQNPWWEVDLGEQVPVDEVVLWNRSDAGVSKRLDGARLILLNEDREQLFTHAIAKSKPRDNQISVREVIPVAFTVASGDFREPASEHPVPRNVSNDLAAAEGEQTQRIVLIPSRPIQFDSPGKLVVHIESGSETHISSLEDFQTEVSFSQSLGQWILLGEDLQRIQQSRNRKLPERKALFDFFACNLASSNIRERERVDALSSAIQGMKAKTSVPIMRELPPAQARQTFVQIRGNYRAKGEQVRPGTPAVFHSPVLQTSSSQVSSSQVSNSQTNSSEASNSGGSSAEVDDRREISPDGRVLDGGPLDGRPLDRLGLAKWLVDRRNPLTARVWVNRMWESLFGLGIVRTSEDFGSQGDRPTHPELLDWLAVEFMDSGWDNKQMLRLLVTSRTYMQTSQVSQESLARDQDNVWLARGPRVRLSAEMVRDQALAAAGLLSDKMFGEPVRPPQPDLGLKAAFGSATDWKPSSGEDRFRRGVYTSWRRSSPYPSMAAFDAPSREVCTLRRENTNTPLQALVTLNDPAYVEAAQGLARRIVLQEFANASPEVQARKAFVFCTGREPTQFELQALVELRMEAMRQLSDNFDAALKLATDPIGPLPPSGDAIELAGFTVVCNVILNLDEVLMKR